jgi:hypothetical protein
MMVTIQAGKRALGACLLLLLVASCSREQQNWRSAEAADTIESYTHFIQRNPDSELVTQARTRIAQLEEDRDWQRAGSADSADGYRQFIAQHPAGRWTQEARIRADNFALGAQSKSEPSPDAKTARAAPEESTVPAPATARAATEPAAPGAALASPGEAAVPAGREYGQSTGAYVGGSLEPRLTPGEAAIRAGRSTEGTSPGSTGPAPGSSAGGTSVFGAGAVSEVAAAGHPAPVNAAPALTGGPPGQPSTIFAIQLGAFTNEMGASNQWRMLVGMFPDLLGGLTERLVPADTPSGRIFRLQAAVGFEANARALCDALHKRAEGFVVVLPH